MTAAMIDSYTPGANPDDEIDIEFVGKSLYELQTNYFAINEFVLANGKYYPTPSNTYEVAHNVCVARTPQKIEWWMDGKLERTLLASSVPGKFPYRPSKVVFTVWDGGSGAQGTSDWAGGPTDWSNPAPPEYRFLVERVQIRCEDENGKWVDQKIGSGETCETTSTTTTTTTVGWNWDGLRELEY